MKGIIFDFNGTLFQDSSKHEEAWKEMAKIEFDRKISDDEFVNYVHGRNNQFIIEYLSGQNIPVGEMSEISEKKETIYRRLCLDDKEHFFLTDGAEELLDFLKLRDFPRAIATGAGESNVSFYIEAFNLRKWFSLENIIYDDGTIAGKPEPEFYIKAAKALNVPTKDCIVAEDTICGICSAKNAGIGIIVAICPSNKREHLRTQSGIHSRIRDFHEFDRTLLDIGDAASDNRTV
jgi:beta-phosphoglucomutase-like phosphatase (HAD superfamily)